MKKHFSYFNRWFNYFVVVFVIFGFIGLLTPPGVLAADLTNEAYLNQTFIQSLNDQDLSATAIALASNNTINTNTEDYMLGGTHYKANLIVDQYIMTNRDGGALKRPNLTSFLARGTQYGAETECNLAG